MSVDNFIALCAGYTMAVLLLAVFNATITPVLLLSMFVFSFIGVFIFLLILNIKG